MKCMSHPFSKLVILQNDFRVGQRPWPPEMVKYKTFRYTRISFHKKKKKKKKLGLRLVHNSC